MNNKKKILVLASTFPKTMNDSEPDFIYQLCERLSHQFEIHVLVPHAQGLPYDEQWHQLHIHRFRYAPERWEKLAYHGGILDRIKQHKLSLLLIPFFILGQTLTLKRLLSKIDFDLIHAHWVIPQSMVAATVLRATSPPLLTTTHGGDLFALNHPLFKRLKQWGFSNSAHTTVVSQSMVQTASDLQAKQISVIPMGTDFTHLFKEKADVRQPYHLIFVGRLVEKKGITFLLHALPAIIQRYPMIQLTIVGGGPLLTDLQAQAEALKIQQHCTFTGMIPHHHIPPLLQSSKIAIFPFIEAKNGDQEGFGLVVPEAMGAGCAVITTDIPATQDTMKPDIGLMVKQKSSTELSNAVIQLLQQTNETNIMAKKGKHYARHHFSWEKTSQQYAELMHQIISSHATQSLENKDLNP